MGPYTLDQALTDLDTTGGFSLTIHDDYEEIELRYESSVQSLIAVHNADTRIIDILSSDTEI